MLAWLAAIFLAFLPSPTSGHGRLMDPPARNSMWRLGFANPVNYNDNELYCGGRVTQWARNKGKCGVCGDPYHKNREHETGGKYANGIITRDYVEGDVIFVSILITANHQGYFEFRICPMDNPKVEVSQECLDKHLLSLDSGEGTRYYLDKGKSNHFFNYSLTLPPDLTCKHCVLQWKYRTGNTWDKDPSGKFCVGCGPQEEFFNCADVAVHESYKRPQLSSPNKNIKEEKKLLETLAVPATEKTTDMKLENTVKSPYLKIISKAYKAENIPRNPASLSLYRNSIPKNQLLRERAELLSQRDKPDKRQVFKSSMLLENRNNNSPFQFVYPSNSHISKYEVKAVANTIKPNDYFYPNVPFRKIFTQRPVLNKISNQKDKSKGHLGLSGPYNIPPTSSRIRQARIEKYHKIQNSPRPKTSDNLISKEGKSENNRKPFHHEITESEVPTSGEKRRHGLANRWKNLRLHQMTAMKKTHKSTFHSTPTSLYSIKKSASDDKPGPSQGSQNHISQSNKRFFYINRYKTSSNAILDGSDAILDENDESGSQYSIKDVPKSISDDFTSKFSDNGYTETKKTYVHQKLPHWLIKTLRMRSGKTKELTHGRSQVTQNLEETGKPNSFKPDDRPKKSFQVHSKQNPRMIETSRLQGNLYSHVVHNNKIHDVRVNKASRFDEHVDTVISKDDTFLDSSEEESLIRKIVQFILQSRKDDKTSRERENQSDSSSGVLEPSREFFDRSITETRFKPYPRSVLASTPSGHRADRDDSHSSQDYSVHSSGGRPLGGSPLKSVAHYQAPDQQHSYDERLNFKSPTIHWLRTIPSAMDGTNFNNKQNELYLKSFGQSGPKAVPYSNLQSLGDKKYMSLDKDVSFSQSYSNTNQIVNHPADVSSNRNMNMQRHADYQKQQNSLSRRRESNLDNFVSDQFIQNSNLLWAPRTHQRQHYSIQRKKPRLVCKGAVRLGGGMDQWCNANCNANYCPSSMCICRVEETTLIPVITSFASNPAGIIGGVNGVAWVPLSRENPILTQARESSSPYFPQTSVYRSANALSKRNYLNSNVGYKFDSFHNDRPVQRYPRSSDIMSYYSQLSRSVSPKINYSFSPKHFTNHAYDTLLHGNIPKTLGTHPRPTDLPRSFDSNSIKMVIDQRRKMNQRTNNQEMTNYYIPGSSSHSQPFPDDDFFLQNEMVYHKNREDSSFYDHNTDGPF